MELTSKLSSACPTDIRAVAENPRDTDSDDFDDLDAREWEKRAVLEVLGGARTVDAMWDKNWGVEWMGEAICISSSLFSWSLSAVDEGAAESSKAGREGREGTSCSWST